MSRGRQYPKELKERAVRTAMDSGRPIAQDLGIGSESLRKWVRQAEADAGTGVGPTSAEREEIRVLKREVYELRRQNEILKAASVFFAKELDGTPRR